MKNWINLGVIGLTLLMFQMCTPSSDKTKNAEVVVEVEETEDPAIVIYGSNTCSHCIDFKAKLDSIGLDYVFNDVDVSDEQALIMMKRVKEANFPGRISFPTVFINGKDLLMAPEIGQVLEALKQK